MTKKILISIVVLIISFGVLSMTPVLAEDSIDMNLTENSTSTNNTNDTSNTNTSENTNTNSNYSYTGTSDSASSPTVSNIDSIPESELGLTNILNILLIVIGILLVLLSIAILIRLKH